MRKFRSHINIRLLTLLAFALWVPMCMLGVFLGLTSHSVSATDNSTSQVNVDLVNGIAIRILNSAATSEIENLNLSIDPVPGGVFTSGNFNVEVSTSNKTGYKLYMSSGTSSTALINQIDSSFTIPSISSATTSSSFTPNTWGYSLDSTNYNPIPATGSPDQVKYTATPSASDLTPVNVGMNVDMSKASGIYSNQLTFTAVAEPVPIGYTLAYDANGGTGAPASQSSTTTTGSETFTISNTKPTRYNYLFKGWSESSSSETGSGSGPNGLYVGGDTITVSATGWDDMTKTLYAVWYETTFWSITDMQEMTSEICASLYTPSNATASSNPAVQIISDRATYNSTVTANNQPYVAQRTLRDIRDSNDSTNSYTVAKLADGNCWMTQNLRIVGPKTLTASDSNVSTDFPLTASNSGSWCEGDNATCDNQAMVLDSNSLSYGAYYNWYAATAGSGKYETAIGDAEYSICPKGWKIPTGGNEGQLRFLHSQYSNVGAMMESPVNFVIAGARIGSNTSYQNTYGYYWSSTVSSSSSAYRMIVSPNELFHGYAGKFVGFSVRCIAK